MVAGGAEAADLPARHRRLRRLPRAVDRLQRHARARLAPLGQGPRRLRHGRGRRRRRARGATSTRRSAAPRSMPRCVGYGLSGDAYHITAPAEDGNGGFRAMQAALKRAGMNADGHRLHQRARHLDAAGRRDRARRGEAAVRRGRAQASRCPRPSRRSATCWAPPARSRRSSRILAIRDQVAPPTLNLDNPSPRLRHRPGAQAGQASARSDVALVELLRLRRHQRQPDLRRAA